MFIKVITTALVICGLVMVFAMPYVLGQRPPDAEKVELAHYGARVLAYFGMTCFVWIGAAIGALVVMRRARLEYLKAQGENVKGLVEGTLRDHERKD